MQHVRLIHPVWIIVERSSVGVMIMDEDTRQPVHGARSAAVADGTGGTRIQAQVKWGRKGEPDIQPGGLLLNNEGYVICLTKDMNRILGMDQRFKYGDRITTIGKEYGLSLYIGKADPCFHDPSFNGALGYKYHFSDRDPNI